MTTLDADGPGEAGTPAGSAAGGLASLFADVLPAPGIPASDPGAAAGDGSVDSSGSSADRPAVSPAEIHTPEDDTSEDGPLENVSSMTDAGTSDEAAGDSPEDADASPLAGLFASPSPITEPLSSQPGTVGKTPGAVSTDDRLTVLTPKTRDLPPGLAPASPASSAVPATSDDYATTGVDFSVAASPFGHANVPLSAADASRSQEIHDANLQAARDAITGRRYAEAERLWPIVDEILLTTGTDPILQERTSRLEFTRNVDVDEAQMNDLFEVLKPRLAAAGVMIPDQWDVPALLAMAYDEILGISVLGDLWRDPEITEIMVDRWDSIVVETKGRLEDTSISFRSPDHANAVARALALRVSDRAVSRTIPLVTAELPQARVTFAYGPVVKGGLSITIRKFKPLLGLDSLLEYGSLSPEMVSFLKDSVHARAGVLVSGGTGSGKTTIVNLLSSFIPDEERVITIEDAFELSLENRHVVSLQTKEAASLDDAVSVTLPDLLRNTLRMRPDRIIVGEIREGEGASVMLAAANTGHDGTMTTIHANTASLALNERFVDLVRQVRATSDDPSIRRTITSAFDLVVQVTRGRGGRRFVSEIASVDEVGQDGRIRLSPVFQATEHADGTVSFMRFPIDAIGSIGTRLAHDEEVLGKWTRELS